MHANSDESIIKIIKESMKEQQNEFFPREHREKYVIIFGINDPYIYLLTNAETQIIHVGILA